MSVTELNCKLEKIERCGAVSGFALSGFVVLFFWLVASATVHAADTSKILGQCRALSLLDDDIHNCLDNYLDVLDDNLAGIGDFIRVELSAAGSDEPVLQAFESSQLAFENYRSSNCLWYLEFSSPRNEAEQIAKNCLASMSEQRLAELQLLVKNQSRRDLVAGYYVYGAERNSFQPCGSDKRYWVEGENVAVSEIQQLYLSKVNTDLQVMFVELAGELDTEAVETFAGHNGVFNIDSVITLRTPIDSDCAIPGGANKAATQTAPATTDTPLAIEQPVTETSSDTDTEEPVQTLIAYFGDWTARCDQLGSSYGCVLSILMNTPMAESPDDAASLIITRRSEQRTIIDVDVPLGLVPSLDDIEKLHWNVDSIEFGALLHSRLESRGPDGAQTHIRQALRERWFIRDNLIPAMRTGSKLLVSLLPDDDNGIVLSATLLGLTRALEFADDFTAAQGEI